MFSHYTGLKLKMNYRKKLNKFTEIWKFLKNKHGQPKDQRGN